MTRGSNEGVEGVILVMVMGKEYDSCKVRALIWEQVRLRCACKGVKEGLIMS